jgi:hypothetical protein
MAMEEREEIKKNKQIKSPIMPEITTGSLKKTWGKTDTGHKTAKSVTPPFYNLIRNGKFDVQVVTRQQEFWVTCIPEGLQYIISYGGNSSNDDIMVGDDLKAHSFLHHVTHPCCVACEREVIMNDPLLNFLLTPRTRQI